MTRPLSTGEALLAEAQRAMALAEAQAGRFEKARVALERALEVNPRDAPTLVNLGAVHQALRQFDQALDRYGQALSLNPGSPEAWNNRALVLVELRRYPEALESCALAISLRPEYAEAHNNRGLALNGLRRWDEALLSFNSALRHKPHYAKAHHNRGLALLELNKLEEALSSLERAFEAAPSIEGLHGLLLNTRMKLARWAEFDSQVAHLGERLMKGELASQPFAVLSLVDSPSLHRRAAELWVRRECPSPSPDALPARPRVPGEPLRIGYFSADFHHHATSHLMAGLFEAHDRARFHLTAFSFGPDDDKPLARRVRSAFDRFLDVRALSDEQVAQQARELGIDIAVDLKGYTRDSRPGIFAARAAPVQVSYLGYPGTMGASFIDYLIADATLVPEGLRQAYAEQIVLLPGSYQVNDRLRLAAEELPTREQLGLPAVGTVLACFNHTYKLNPEVFGAWARILRACRDSVLWLLEDNEEASRNLRAEAERRGVNSERIVLAPRIPTPEHLARHQQADLFLDTWPYNAHTTASDALWMGVPVVTRLGQGFPGRVAASLLVAAGLPELVTLDTRAYESMAIELASDPIRRQTLREKLLESRDRTALFDTEGTARHLERAFLIMAERHAAGQVPALIDLCR